MSAIPILLADAIATVINAAQAAEDYGTLSFTARRSYPDWDDDFKGLEQLAVDVVFVSSAGSGGALAELDSESTIQTEPAVDISVRYRFGPADKNTSSGRLENASVDALVTLVEQIYETLAGDRAQAITLATGLHANWVDASVRTYCDYGRLRQGVFLGVVRVRYDVSKVA